MSVRGQDGRKGKTGERSDTRRLQSYHEVNACWSIFTHTQARAWVVPTLRAFVFLNPRRHTLFNWWAQLSGMLVLYGTYRDHDKEMKSADTEGA